MRVCKLCFEKIEKSGLYSSSQLVDICQKCFNQFEVIFLKESLDGIETLILYEYNDVMKKNMFQLKGRFDIELGKIFLERYILELKIKYRNYIIVPVPSTKSSDEVRGFNHVEEIYKNLNLPIYPIIKKKEDFKQSDLVKTEREKIINKLCIDEKINLKGKKILLVDDIITTGSSLKACIKLLKSKNPRIIKCLVICKKCRNSENFLDRKYF